MIATHAGRRVATWRIAQWAAIAGLLIAPLVAMRFTREVNWTPFDFVVAGGLLVGAGLAIEIATRRLTKTFHRVIAVLAILGLALVIWAQGAVGVF